MLYKAVPAQDVTDPLSLPSVHSKRCILYIYATNIGTEYFKHGIYSPFFFPSKCSLFRNSNVFGSCIIHILYRGCAKIKNKIKLTDIQRDRTYCGLKFTLLLLHEGQESGRANGEFL